MSETSQSASIPPVLTEPSIQRARTLIGFRRSAAELAAMLSLVWLTDLLIYQVGTFTSWSILFAIVAVVITLSKLHSTRWRAFVYVALGLLAIMLKLVWAGSVLQVVCGLVLLVCLSLAAAGTVPWLPEGLLAVPLILVGAFERLLLYTWRPTENGRRQDTTSLLATGIPALVIASFSGLFVLANPDLLAAVQLQAIRIARIVGDYVQSLSWLQLAFWCISASLLLGLVFPKTLATWSESPENPPEPPATSKRFAVSRNTLLSVSVLFAAYLVFELKTLWFRRLPDNFYYAGYAHEGAFWLTTALALSTLVLSFVFRGRTIRDPRLPQLKILAWVWSFENFLLALAVVNRMVLYVNYNGMTPMRVVGFLGISAVMGGFAMVVIKIARSHNFAWLIHRQLWCPVVALITFAILPVDMICSHYNTSQVNRGNLAPAVQIIAHLHSTEGGLPLIALVDCETPQIREGTRALLAHWAIRLEIADKNINSEELTVRDTEESIAAWQSPLGHSSPWLAADEQRTPSHSENRHWLNFQMSEYLLRRSLVKNRESWQAYADSHSLRRRALNTFFEHTYQWY